MDSPEVWLDGVLAAPDPWMAAAAEPWPPDLVRVVEDRYPRAGHRRFLVWLLGKSGEDGARALARLLETASGTGAVDLLATLARTGPTHANPATVRRLLADPEAGRVAADLAGMSGDHSFVPDLVPLLDDRDRRCGAAIALGRLHAREHTARIAAELRRLTGLDRQAFVVALELMGDPTVVPTLLRGKLDGDVHHALARLTGRHPLVKNLRKPRAIRAAWASVDVGEPAQPDLRNVRVSGTRAEFVLEDGECPTDPPGGPRCHRAVI
jgi:hypothetical protein